MGVTLLIPGSSSGFREWLRDNLAGRDLVCLDPKEGSLGTPARLSVYREEKAVAWRFFGGLDPLRAPHVFIAGLSGLMKAAHNDAVWLAFPYRPAAPRRQLLHLMANVLRPERIFVSNDAKLDLNGWPVLPELVECDPELPVSVLGAQRRAQWVQLLSKCESHELSLSEIRIEGSRLGSGEALSETVRRQIGLSEAPYAEICGPSLFVVSESPLDDEQIARALNSAHCARAHIVAPEIYSDRLCSFATEEGEDFGMGVIERIDFVTGRLHIKSTAVAQTPVPILRIGALTVDSLGREIEESKPWEF